MSRIVISARSRRAITGGSLTALTYLLAFVMVFPLLWLLLTAFKTEQEAVTLPPLLVFTPTLENFVTALDRFGPAFWTTFWAVLLSTVVSLMLGLPAAFGLAGPASRLKTSLLLWVLGTKMMPPVGIILPLFLIYRDLGILDTRLGLILIYTTMNLSLVIWMMTAYFSDLPPEIFEAGRLDGLGPLGEFLHLGLTLVMPGAVSTALLCVILAWNEFLFALILTSTDAVPLSIFITGFKSAEGLFWAQMSAASILTIAPILLLGWVAQRRLVRGLTLGAVK